MLDSTNICRVCLEESGDLKSFEEKLMKNVEISKCYEDLTTIKVKSCEIQSKICLKCLEKLEISYNFKQQCLINDLEYQKIVEGKFESTEKDTDSVEKEFSSELTRRRKDQTKKETNNKRNSGIKDKTKNPKEKLLKKEERQYFCSFCGKQFSNSNYRTNHEHQVHIKNQKFICDICGRIYHNKSKIADHLRRHIGSRDFKCDQCDSCFVVRQGLLNHKKFVHNLIPKNVSCPHCDLKFFTQAHLRLHVKNHFQDRAYECLICGKSYRHKNSLVEHSREHEPKEEFPFECKNCDKKFTRASHFYQHSRQHHSKNLKNPASSSFSCDACEKTFKTKNSLADHKKIHFGVKDFTCSYPNCRKTFRLKQALVRHIQAVHLDLTFNCEICNETLKLRKQFQKTYIEHIQNTHTDLKEEDFNSLKRKIKFLRFKDVSNNLPTIEVESSTLNTAMFSKQCPDCYLTFGTYAILLQHIEKNHPERSVGR